MKLCLHELYVGKNISITSFLLQEIEVVTKEFQLHHAGPLQTVGPF